MSEVRRVAGAGVVAGAAVFALVLTVNGQSKIACDPDNGGIKLPQGFCALVVANDLGTARHLAVAPNGDLYVATQSRGGRGQPETGGGVVGAARRQRRRQVRSPGADRHRQHDRRRPAQRLSLPRAPEDHRTLQDDGGSAEADRRRRDRRHGSAARRAAARRQGPDVRRQGLALHQRRRAEQRLPAARSPARREGSGSLPDSREARRHLEVRREQAGPDAGAGHASSRPACASSRRSPGTTARSTS